MQMQILDAMDAENKKQGKSKGTYLVIGNLEFFKNLVIMGWWDIRHRR